jgi:hypothetical protein
VAAGVLNVALLGTLALASFGAIQDTTRADAASMARKVTAIEQRATLPPSPKTPALRTTFTEREANAYFQVNGHDFLPAGVINPNVVIDVGGRVQARAVVDLQQALKTKDRSMFDPLAWLGTSVEVTAAGTLVAVEGKGKFQLESATLSGIPVPISVLQEIVSYYSRTPDAPQGLDLNQPFALPASIRSVQTTHGAATVVQ